MDKTTDPNQLIQTTRSPPWSVIQGIIDSGHQDEAFYVFELNAIYSRYQDWKRLMPRVEPHYAVKCNDMPVVLKVLAALGSSFDCGSEDELNKILDLGVPPSKIIFTNPCKAMKHIRHAADMGVKLMTFDNESELQKIRGLHPRARMLLRIRCDDSPSKYGCDPIIEAPRLLELAQSLNLDVAGISFHIGTNSPNPYAYEAAIAAARNVFNYGHSMGLNLNLLDIGGGFPTRNCELMKTIASVVNQSIDAHFPDESVQVVAEPGRFMVTSAFTLAASIHSKRTNISADVLHHMYYINASTYAGFSSVMYNQATVVPIPLKTFSVDTKLESSSVWGPTCDGLDLICEEVRLPELFVGDWMVFEDMGADNLSITCPFNGFPMPKVHTIITKDVGMKANNATFFSGHPIKTKST